MATPNLEHFQLDSVLTSWHPDYDLPPAEYNLWPSLCKLKLGPHVFFQVAAPHTDGYARFLPLLTNNLRSLEILSTRTRIAPAVLSNCMPQSDSSMGPANGTSNPENPHTHLLNIEVFRCLNPVDTGTLQAFLEPAAKAGNLKVLELCAPKTSHTSPGNPFNPTADLAFALSDNLHTLGLHDFNFHHDPTSRFGTTSQFHGQPFLDWLECFPKLHTVAVYPGQWEGVASFVAKLILHPKVKVVHQDGLKGVEWYEATKLAEKHGVELRHTPARVPISWQAIEDGGD
jgi:hypothetical protein